MEFLDSCNLGYTNTEWLSLSDIAVLPLFSLLPKPMSNKISTGVEFAPKYYSSIPFAKMGGFNTIVEAGQQNHISIIAPEDGQDYQDYMEAIKQAYQINAAPIVTVGSKESDLTLIDEVLKLNENPLILIREPYAETQVILEQITRIRRSYGNRINLIVGDFVNAASIMNAINAGVSGVILGSSGLKSTYVPDFSILNSARKIVYAMKKNVTLYVQMDEESPKNAATAFAAGADVVLLSKQANVDSFTNTLRELLFLTNSSDLVQLYDNARFVRLSTSGMVYARNK